MDITIRGVEGITEQELLEWVAVLVERKENLKLNSIQAVSEAVSSCKSAIDVFRKANALQPKFEAVTPKE